MYFPSIHILPIPRRFSLHPPVANIGYAPHKRDWVRHTFDTLNFSFILRGGGEYHLGDGVWPVRAPCVITQVPGVQVEYGATAPWDEWEELYLIYEAAWEPQFQAAGIDARLKPCWNMTEFAPALTRLHELQELLRTPQIHGTVATRIDQACAALVLESLFSEQDADLDADSRRIREIQLFLRTHFLEEVDMSAIAQRYGMSFSTFRRKWGALSTVPPAQYLLQLRIREACRLLVESDLSVAAIAERLRFRDPLYFSRRFRLATGLTATAYRATHRLNHPAAP